MACLLSYVVELLEDTSIGRGVGSLHLIDVLIVE